MCVYNVMKSWSMRSMDVQSPLVSFYNVAKDISLFIDSPLCFDYHVLESWVVMKDVLIVGMPRVSLSHDHVLL